MKSINTSTAVLLSVLLLLSLNFSFSGAIRFGNFKILWNFAKGLAKEPQTYVTGYDILHGKSDDKNVTYGGPFYCGSDSKPNNNNNCQYEPDGNYSQPFYYVCFEGSDPCVFLSTGTGLLPNLLGIVGVITTVGCLMILQVLEE